MTTMTPAVIAPAAEMAGGLNLKCSDTGRGAFGRNGGHPALWRSLLILVLLLLPTFLLSACADIRIGGSCVVNGEEFTHVSNAIFEIRRGGFSPQVLETHTKTELKVHRAPRPWLLRWQGKELYQCVVKKSDWLEAMPAKLSFGGSDKVTAVTPRGQAVSFDEHDIDHWELNEGWWE